jgi:hypothetical protein
MSETKWSNLETAKRPSFEEMLAAIAPRETFDPPATITAEHAVALIRCGAVTRKRDLAGFTILGGVRWLAALNEASEGLPE